ncbi:hypothetical protein Pcinc_038936 [Petrolisthes cinctipes]|uniref:Defective in cullin neddylation protein n=1 Tax=Petrolisthes cinctipes TaxID=88211 RepID=A0AAE1BSN9_PETCI|nr:hypothetical protein Pcinc_038936 [Petrolisthes cinctipes]
MATVASLCIVLILLTIFGSGLDTVCLNHYGCFKDQYLDWIYITNTLQSRQEERSAVTCASACLHSYPDTELVLVKLVGVNELLNCGCGSQLALGNGSGLAQDHYDCYVCPDVDNQKCGSDKTFSVYLVHHNDAVGHCERLELELNTINTTTPTTTTITAPTKTFSSSRNSNATAKASSSNITSIHNDSSSLSPVNVTTPATIIHPDSPSSPTLVFLGCYDEERVNESLVLTLYLEGDGVDVVDCYQNCSRLHPATTDLILVKLLKTGRVYCGCSWRGAVGPEALVADCDLYCHDDLDQQCGGWNAVSAYAGSPRHTIAFGLLEGGQDEAGYEVVRTIRKLLRWCLPLEVGQVWWAVGPMGKCLSCLKVPPQQQQQQLQQQQQHHSSLHHHLPPRHDHERAREVSESGSSVSGVEGRSPVPPPDTQSNGSGKNSIIISGSDKRLFCPRIPPLAKTGNEVRRLPSKEYSESKIAKLFDHYKDQHCELILSEGIESLCMDLDVKPEEFKVLVLAWKFGAETMCRFSRSEFFNGCKALKVDSIKGIQSKFPEMLLEVQDPEKFRDLYRFTFKFGLDAEAGQRILPSDMAVLLWKLVFSQREPSILKRWLTFLERHPNIRGIPRDTWNMFLNFIEVVGDDLGSYDDTEAWPSLFDDFVEHENDQLNQNISKDHKEESE